MKTDKNKKEYKKTIEKYMQIGDSVKIENITPHTQSNK